MTAEAAARVDTGVDVEWPVMKIRLLGPTPRTYEFQVAVNIGDRATSDAAGKFTHHHFRAYVFAVRDGDRAILEGVGGESPLITVKGRSIDVRVPLKSLGVDHPGSAPMEIADANSLPRFFPYRVSAFAR